MTALVGMHPVSGVVSNSVTRDLLVLHVAADIRQGAGRGHLGTWTVFWLGLPTIHFSLRMVDVDGTLTYLSI